MKMHVFAVVFMMLIAVIPAAIAHENETELEIEVENETELEVEDQGHETEIENEIEIEDETLELGNRTIIEVESMSHKHGAQVRLLQLQKAIERNILLGNATIEAIRQANSTANLTELESIIAEMEALKIQVSQVNPDGNSSEAAKRFVELKHDAIELTKQFRTKARMILKENADRIRLKIKVRVGDEIRELDEQIRKEKREFNAERLNGILSKMKARNKELEEKILSGNATIGEIRSTLMRHMNELRKEMRTEALEELREERSKMKILRQSIIQEANDNFTIRKIERMEQRIEGVKDGRVREKIEERLEKLENNTRTKIEKRIEKSEDGTRVRIKEKTETRQKEVKG